MSRVIKQKGFTLVELLIVCVVIALLAVIAIVAYSGLQQRAAQASVYKDLRGAAEQLSLTYVRSVTDFDNLSDLPEDFHPSEDVFVQLVSSYGGDVYTGLSAVQNGVLFYEVCEELIADPQYSVIHARDGSETQSVVMKCTDDIGANRLQITGWRSEKWYTPVTRADIQEYIDEEPYDDWWTDRQDVVRGFYTELANRFEAKGGTFPITSFWDTWANQWSGVHKEELPPPGPRPSDDKGAFCVEAWHNKFPEQVYKITQNEKIVAGRC